MYTGYGSTTPPLTNINNPFLSQSGQPASSRFPDISSTIPSSNGSAWPNGSTMTGSSYPQYQQPSMQNGYGGSPQPGFGNGGMNTAFSPTQSFPSSSFQMQGGYDTSFGQQHLPSASPRVSGSSYSYLTGQQPPNTSYNPAQQQLQNNTGYHAQFDPYSAIGQGWDAGGSIGNTGNRNPSPIGPSTSTSSTLSTASSMSSPTSFGVGPKGDLHPRDFIRTHKVQIEAWDAYAWKQLLNVFDAMKNAWEERRAELMTRAKGIIAQGQAGMAYGGYYAQQIQQEASRLQQLLREAELNFDSVAASLFQMQEVFQGYRQSGDAASKARVREATNATLQGLPGWPLPL